MLSNLSLYLIVSGVAASLPGEASGVRDMTGTRAVKRATTTRKRSVDPTNTSLEPANRGEAKVVQLATYIMQALSRNVIRAHL